MKYEMPEIRQGRHYLVWFSMGFISGIFLWLSYPELGNIPFSLLIIYSAGAVTLTGVVMLLLPRIVGKSIMDFADRILVFIILTGFTAGLLRAYNEDGISHKELEDTFGTECRYTGYVTSEPKSSKSGKTKGFSVHVTSAEDLDGIKELSDNIYLYTDDDCDGLIRGDVIAFSAKLSKPSDASFRGGFSLRNNLYKDGIRASTYIPKIERTGQTFIGFSLKYSMQTLGIAVQDGILSVTEKYLGEYKEEYALLKGILFGNKEDFSTEQYNNFADSGFIHITAASGMHVSYLCGFIFSVLRFLRVKRRIIYFFTIPVLFIFAAAAAFTPSICRAVIMMCIYVLACILQREPDSLTSLAAAGLILLCINPYAATDYSFILSFAAVLGIIIFSVPLQNNIKLHLPAVYKGKKAVDTIIDSACLSVSGNMGLGYFIARFFNRFSWGGIIGNILVIPLGAVCFIGGFVIWILDFAFPIVAKVAAEYPIRLALFLMNKTAEIFALPFFNLYMPTPSYSFFPIYVMICGVLYWSLENKLLTNRK